MTDDKATVPMRSTDSRLASSFRLPSVVNRSFGGSPTGNTGPHKAPIPHT